MSEESFECPLTAFSIHLNMLLVLLAQDIAQVFGKNYFYGGKLV